MILNLNSGDGGKLVNEVGVLLTEFMSEVNDTLTSFKSEINTMLTGFTNGVDSDIASLNTNLSSVKTDVATVKSNVSTLSTTVNSLPKGAVKSVQRGTVTPTADEDMVINIKSVNPDKCLVLMHREKNDGNANFFAMPYELTSTTLKVTKSSYYYVGYQMVRFNWQVIEFY